ncbi:hypothetical protein HKD37_04G009056 [Glycine soja]
MKKKKIGLGFFVDRAVKVGALKAAEAEAPASPSKEDSERSIENGENPLLLPEKTLVSPRLPLRRKIDTKLMNPTLSPCTRSGAGQRSK